MDCGKVYLYWHCSSDDYDFEYEPNPHRQDVAAVEDAEADAEWQLQANDEAKSSSGESVPDSDDSMWAISEDDDLLLIQASQMAELDPTPVVQPPAAVEPQVRPPKACMVCLEELATIACVPCGHVLVCRGCKPAFSDTVCLRCGTAIQQLMEVFST